MMQGTMQVANCRPARMMRRCSTARRTLRKAMLIAAVCMVLAWCFRSEGTLSTSFIHPTSIYRCSPQAADLSWTARLGIASLLVAPWGASAVTAASDRFDPELPKLGIEIFFGLVTLAVLINPGVFLDVGKSIFRREGTSCKVSHILVTEKELADQLFAQCSGKSFKEFSNLARLKSVCGTAKNGGDLGDVERGQMVPEFDQVCFDPAQPIGVPIGPVKTDFGYHIIWVVERPQPS